MDSSRRKGAMYHQEGSERKKRLFGYKKKRGRLGVEKERRTIYFGWKKGKKQQSFNSLKARKRVSAAHAL